MEQTNKPTYKHDQLSYAKWVGFGVEFCGVLAICSYFGYKLDQWLNSSPWFLLAGFFVGFAGMMYLVIKEAFPEKFRRK
jgi:F0F1-type ATP synthase assembly protein I